MPRHGLRPSRPRVPRAAPGAAALRPHRGGAAARAAPRPAPGHRGKGFGGDTQCPAFWEHPNPSPPAPAAPSLLQG